MQDCPMCTRGIYTTGYEWGGGGGGEGGECTFAITVLGLNLAELNYHISPKFGSSKMHPQGRIQQGGHGGPDPPLRTHDEYNYN